MKCPICGNTIEKNTLFVCSKDWWKLSGTDRSALASLHRKGNKSGVQSKLASIVRRAKEQSL